MQMKHQYLEGLILSVLYDDEIETYPYKIAAELGKKFGVSASAVYNACARLYKEGFATTSDAQYVVSGRTRKYYQITEKGIRRLQMQRKEYQAERQILDQWLGGAE